MKKIVIATALCMGVLTQGALAAEYSVAPGTETVTVTEQLAPGTSGFLVVVKAGESIENNAETYAAEHCTANEEGLAIWSFDMPTMRNSQSTEGKYDLYIKPADGGVEKDVMYFATSANRISLKNRLQQVVSSGDIDTILSSDTDVTALGSEGFSVDTYKNLVQHKSTISSLVFNEVQDFSGADPADVAKELNNAVALVGIKNDSAKAEEYLNITDMVFEGTSFKNISDDALALWLTENMKTVNGNSLSEMKGRYNAFNILYIINNTRVSDIGAVIDKYADNLGINNSSEYLQYKGLASKAVADENIVNELKKAPAASENALKAIILKAIPVTQNYPQGGSGGGSTGSGSFGGGTSLGGAVISSIPDNTVMGGFYDLQEAAWAVDAIIEMADAKIISGDGNGYFNPNDTMTREQFITMLVLALGSLDENAECSFDDTDVDQWHYRYIASAYNKGIAQGINENSFGTGTYLTRQDMAVLCYRAADGIQTEREKITFYDDSDIADYAKEAVYGLYEAGAISGMGENRFEPKGTATRAQGAMIIYNLFFAKQ